ncbi:MAG: tRNA pseudouridine(55) synthase TruB [Holosporales bacterium]|jgi:tRNA pseudouridine55 synthase|nr:tRNA pseudouridine(55) synthase TruB [Holosporales bacterium]
MSNGIILLDKPAGMSSTFAGTLCKRILGIKKIGHIGTLDPLATGVLPLAINAGTKIIPFINTSKKIYDFEMKFGIKTDTGDNTGEILTTNPLIPSLSDIERVIQNFIGEQYQKPHPFSAVKINGTPAYRMARRGESPELQSKLVNIFDICILSDLENGSLKLRAAVSPGTYIRSLAEDISHALGTFGHVTSLRRVMDGKFCVGDAITIDKLREKKDNIHDVLISFEDVLDDIPVFFVSEREADDLSLGRSVVCGVNRTLKPGIVLASSSRGFWGIVDRICDDEKYVLVPKRILVFGKKE